MVLDVLELVLGVSVLVIGGSDGGSYCSGGGYRCFVVVSDGSYCSGGYSGCSGGGYRCFFGGSRWLQMSLWR